jgi:hypothetical protein
MHGVGSGGATQTPQVLDAVPRKSSKTHLFISRPSTPLCGSHNMHIEEGSGGGDGDEVDDLTKYMVDFPKARRVTSTGTLKGTFMVNEEGLPLNQVKVPGNF